MSRLTFLGFFTPMDGYGEGTIAIGRALQRLDPDVRLVDMRPQAHRDEDAARWEVEGTALALCTPTWYPQIHADRLIGATMFEASKLPRDWTALINNCCDEVVVPCDWNVKLFRDNCVRVPVHVARWGVDAEEFPILDRRDHIGLPYTFLWSGTADRRKGWDVAYLAFIEAFGHDLNVRLILHFRHKLAGDPYFADPNLDVRQGMLDRAGWRSMLQEADCFLFPSRGEGWGLPPREAASTGLPVLATNFGGLQDELPNWAIPVGVKGFTPASYGWWDAPEIGNWAEPDRGELVFMLKRLAEQPALGRMFGLRAAHFLHEHTPWERTARRLLAIVNDSPSAQASASGGSRDYITVRR